MQVGRTPLNKLLIIVTVIQALVEGSPSSNWLSDEADLVSGKPQDSWLHWWSYDGISGPDFWSINKRWRLCTDGKRQSPIEIRTDRLLYDPHLNKLKVSWQAPSHQDVTNQDQQHQLNQQNHQQQATTTFSACAEPKDQNLQFELVNVGRGLELWLMQSQTNDESSSSNNLQCQLQIEEGPLSYSYKLFKIELHSGARTALNLAQQAINTSGFNNKLINHETFVGDELKTNKRSEHLIDGRDFDAELQLHFYNNLYWSDPNSVRRALDGLDEASNPHAFATVSILMEPTSAYDDGDDDQADVYEQKQTKDKLNESRKTSTLFDWKYIKQKGSQVNQSLPLQLISISGLQLEALLDFAKSEFVAYEGSLNRPPCSENVDWILANKLIRVSPSRLNKLILNKQHPSNNQNINSSPVQATPVPLGPSDNSISNTNQNAFFLSMDNIRPIQTRNGRQLRTNINLARDYIACDSRSSSPELANNRSKSGFKSNRVTLVPRAKFDLTKFAINDNSTSTSTSTSSGSSSTSTTNAIQVAPAVLKFDPTSIQWFYD